MGANIVKMAGDQWKCVRWKRALQNRVRTTSHRQSVEHNDTIAVNEMLNTGTYHVIAVRGQNFISYVIRYDAIHASPCKV